MAGTDVTLYDDLFASGQLENMWTLASRISKTSFVPDVFRNKPEEVMAAWLAGREVGIGPMMALQKINVIKGKPTQSAELMRALVQSNGHEVWTEEYTTTRVILCGRRAGQEYVNKVAWTLDDAKRANLIGKDNWRQYPRAMLLARATGELCRLMFADVLGGISYTAEEIEDGFLDEPAPAELPPGDEPPRAAETTTRKAAAPRKAVAKRAAMPAAAGPKQDPPQPPLPGEEEDEPASGSSTSDEASESEDPNVMERAKSIAIACQRAGLDDDGRHRLIEVVTNGRVSSSKEVTAEEGGLVLQAAHDITGGRLTLIDGDDGWALIEVEDATGDQAEDANDEPEAQEPSTIWGDEDGWSSEQWKAFVRARGVTITDTIRQAQSLSKEFEPDQPPPASLGHLKGRTELSRLIRGWIEEESEARS